MRETAALLAGATTRSLVLLDEIGRGTSTYDGLAIAWSVAEHLVDRVRCRALFATHYHELCALEGQRPGQAGNWNVSARERGGDVVFLHRLQRGPSHRSFGIAVARLAGLPEAVVRRAQALLGELEASRAALGEAQRSQLSIPLGSSEHAPPAPEAKPDPLRAALAAIDPDRMTPIDALTALARLKQL
jgi:DNA mismatch repair protein MutS